MNTIQLILAIIGFVSLLAAVIAGAWLNQRAIERQIDALRNEMRAEVGSLRNEMRGEVGSLRSEFGSFRQEIKAELRAEIAPLRAEMHALNEKVDRIDQIFQHLYQPVLPGKAD